MDFKQISMKKANLRDWEKSEDTLADYLGEYPRQVDDKMRQYLERHAEIWIEDDIFQIECNGEFMTFRVYDTEEGFICWYLGKLPSY